MCWRHPFEIWLRSVLFNFPAWLSQEPASLQPCKLLHPHSVRSSDFEVCLLPSMLWVQAPEGDGLLVMAFPQGGQEHLLPFGFSTSSLKFLSFSSPCPDYSRIHKLREFGGKDICSAVNWILTLSLLEGLRIPLGPLSPFPWCSAVTLDSLNSNDFLFGSVAGVPVGK